MYIYINSKFLQKWPSANPTTWYKKNMVSKNLMSNVDENVNESNSSNKDLTLLDELNENEVKHNPLNAPMMTRFIFQDCCLI